MISLLWLRHDLRLHDHAGWALAADWRDPVLPIYILPHRVAQTGLSGFDRMGAAKAAFLLQCLEGLDRELDDGFRHRLHTVVADPVELLCDLARNTPCRIITSAPQAPEEVDWINALRREQVTVVLYESQPLLPGFSETDRADGNGFPATFSRFRRLFEKGRLGTVPAPEPAPRQLPPAAAMPAGLEGLPDARSWLTHRRRDATPAQTGGSLSGARHWQAWLTGHGQHYHRSRSQFGGTAFSSAVSAHLALGSLSIRQLWQDSLQAAADEHMAQGIKALQLEFLWREFFHWSMRHHGSQLFAYQGIAPQPGPHPRDTTSAQRYYWRQWCQAQTGLPIIDACLRQLMREGWLSNRGRQVLASFLVHEMGLDWRWGAECFQHYLIDDDVGSNWGNWAYIAGAGHDSRGGRHFDVLWQWHRHDPDQTYARHWLPELASLDQPAFSALHLAYKPRPAGVAYPPAMLNLIPARQSA